MCFMMLKVVCSVYKKQNLYNKLLRPSWGLLLGLQSYVHVHLWRIWHT